MGIEHILQYECAIETLQMPYQLNDIVERAHHFDHDHEKHAKHRDIVQNQMLAVMIRR
jgi:hypothetical protein